MAANLLEDCVKVTISGMVDHTSNFRDNAIWYKIQVEMGDIAWMVERRFRDFEALNKHLIETQGIPVDDFCLPPKKFIGNKDPDFIDKRRNLLDKYLTKLVNFFGKNLPDELAKFLNLYDHEVTFLLRKLALEIFEKGDRFLALDRPYTFSPLQIHAINLRTRMALPPLDTEDQRQDFSHILDFCMRLKHLIIIGSNASQPHSNSVVNDYEMDLSSLKGLTWLQLNNVNLKKLTKIGMARHCLRELWVKNCTCKSINDILLCDTIYKNWEENDSSLIWDNLVVLNFTNNSIEDVKDLGNLAPSLKDLDLSFNRLRTVLNLTALPFLEKVNYTGNSLCQLEDLHLYFGNLKYLSMSDNQISNLSSFSKLFGLIKLDLSFNKIEDVQEVKHLKGLPCLEYLHLTGNPVAQSVDFRVRVFAYFGARASGLYLDNESASLKEVDQASILQAMELAQSK